jgi:hypothetical protein
VAFRDNFYALPHGDPGWLADIDLWGYESGLPGALDALSARERGLPTSVWLGNVVPFIAGLLVRGPDVNEGINNEGRIVEFQELLSPVMCARWSIIHVPQPGSLITSDRAYSFMREPPGPGILIPIDPQTAAMLVYDHNREIALRHDGPWMTEIDHVDVVAEFASLANLATAQYAHSEIFGPAQGVIEEVARHMSGPSPRIPATIVSPEDCDLSCHIYDYHRALSAVNGPPARAAENAANLNFSFMGSEWSTPIAVALTFKERTRGGLCTSSRDIRLDLRWGEAIAEIRQHVGDFRRTDYLVFPYDRVKAFSPPLGLHWHGGSSTYATTFVRDRNAQATVDLSQVRLALGLD